MADYKELLRRAISALPENNGAARRAVYEKARSALVGQLRAIQPPLPAREITQHRLQLEDCIRQVEQEASEAVISLGRDALLAAKPSPHVAQAPAAEPPKEPDPVVPDAPVPASVVPLAVAAPSKPITVVSTPAPQPPIESAREAARPAPAESDVLSIEDIISEAASNSGAEIVPVETTENTKVQPDLSGDEAQDEPAPMPVIQPEGQSAAPMPSPVVSTTAGVQPIPLKPTIGSARRDGGPSASSVAIPASVTRVEPVISGRSALARQAVIEPVLVEETPVETALSAVREVELESDGTREAEGAIERAIETLDREARGETSADTADRSAGLSSVGSAGDAEDSAFEADVAPRRSGAGLTIFLVVFAVLLAGVGGAGYWAWREGYVDLDQMFGTAQAPVTQTAEAPPITTPTLDGPAPSGETVPGSELPSGPGNTATNTLGEPTSALEGLEIEDRLEPTPEAVTPSGGETVLPSLNGGEPKTEERLSGDDTSIAATNDPAASVDPSVLAGSQSLLLEASTDGRTGAVPFSGTVDWTEGVDEVGQPTLVAQASIPARNLNVGVTIRKNADPSLPASHLMEVAFNVPDTFIGGSISSLPGVLLKDEELVPGTPLVGASARVVGNSFLFALSASPDDAAVNSQLLEDRRWLDLAVVYGTGRNAILTLEKDEEAQALFQKVFSSWSE